MKNSSAPAMAASARNRRSRTTTIATGQPTSRRRELPVLECRRNVALRVERAERVGIPPREQRPGERVVQAVTGLERGVLPDQRIAEQVEVADGVQHLVLHELVVVA